MLYSVLSLTLVSMVPVFVCLAGTGERVRSKLFLGWFGPRGLASIVFAIIVLNEKLPAANTLAAVVVCTVCLSVVAHGVTAIPLSRAIVKNKRGWGTPPSMMLLRHVSGREIPGT